MVDASGPLLSHARYEPREVLGRGAQGVVLRVVDREQPGRPLVAKVWNARGDEHALRGEFALLARMRVRGLVAAHDFGQDDRTGSPFFVEDFVEGPDARAWVSGSVGAEANARLAQVLADVAVTLSALHDAGFCHGDLKPAHVRVVDESGASRAVLLDLGAAILLSAGGGAQAFTPDFAAPEAKAGASVTAACDLYSLGATAWAVATGTVPAAVRPPLRTLAPWVHPKVADLIEALLATHPRDRPLDAFDVLRRLGGSVEGTRLGAPPLIGRETVLEALEAPSSSGVRYVIGPSGAGKSHVLRELVVVALLSGREARHVVFPCLDGKLVAQLIAYLRGAQEAWPFVPPGDRRPMLLALDDLHAAPAELMGALEAWRCRPKVDPNHPLIVAGLRTAPDGAESVALGPLDEVAFSRLCRALGIVDEASIADASRASKGSPGWLVAWHGRVPLTRDTVLERARGLSAAASETLAGIALAGGTASADVCGPAGITELLEASLVTRQSPSERGLRYALTTPLLAADVASALASYAIVDRVAAALLADADAEPAALLAVAGGPMPPTCREALLLRAAERARALGLRTEETEAYFALAARPERRDGALLLRLERLVRDAGSAQTHPQVLEWLMEASRHDASLLPLALRRAAERAARDGDADGARRLAEQAQTAARERRDATAEALCLATRGTIALWRADWAEADAALREARARLATTDAADPEELARVDHNAGVVALYRGRTEEAIEAFGRSLDAKRRLGDRAGARSCLLNLGIALTKAERWEEAARALDEAIALARSLGQKAGRAWCLAARAEIDVRQGHATAAERWIAEARALGDDVPPVVQADLSLLRAEVALLEGDGKGALAVLSAIPERVRTEQALVDTRARVLSARAHLATLPADARRSSRLSIDAIRRARRAGLPEVEAQAIGVLRASRARRRYAASMPTAVKGEDAAWAWLGDVAAGRDVEEAALSLAGAVVRESGAERAFVGRVDGSGRLQKAWGIDVDGLAVASPEQRIDAGLLGAVFRRDAPVYERDTPTAGGRGARIAVSAPQAIVVAEHRFQVGRFDALREELPRRWATLAGVLMRLADASPAATRGTDVRDASVEVPGGDPKGILATTTAFPDQELRHAFPAILGESAALRRALAKLDAAIDSDLPVLLVGETGVGKELFARALHEKGPRARAPFVALNCGAVPDALFESELFGHARGSFTSADRARPGLLARAEGGTLLLDEIGELPVARQAVLLRVLESHRYRSVGTDEERPFDVRIIAATNRDLARAIEDGTFRRDLLYRLNVVEIPIPPLRERLEDVPALVRAFLDEAGSSAKIAPDAMDRLAAYTWPGNVRELGHVIQRLAATRTPVIVAEHLPRGIRSMKVPTRLRRPADERTDVERALSRTGGNITHAARALGLTRQGLKKRMDRLGMREGRS